MKKLTLLAALAVASIGSASAGSLLTPVETEAFNLSFGSPSQTVFFNGFDSSLGTLESVHLTLQVNSASLESFASVLTGGTGSVSGAFSTGSLSVSGPLSLLASFSLSTDPITAAVSGFFTSLDTATLPAAVNVLASLLAPTDLSSYIGGTDAVSLNLASQTQQSGTCVFPTSCGTNGGASGFLSVYYDYSAPTTRVPEPAMLGLMGLGFAAMGAVRRRRQA